MRYYYILISALLSIGCKTSKNVDVTQAILKKDRELTALGLQTWYHQDYQKDTVPGISLDKWYAQNKKKRKSKSIIVAVIDTQIDQGHEDLQGQIWTNRNEIAGNSIDDDHNGYIDDVNGWNFTSNKNGDYVVWGNFEYIRILREWGQIFKSKTEDQISPRHLPDYREYQRALKIYEEENSDYKNWLKSSRYSVALFPIVKDSLKHYFPNEDYTYQQLDSLYKKYKINDKTFKQRREDDDRDIGAMIGFMKVRFDFNEKTLEKMKETEDQLDSIVSKNINIDFDERLLIGDNAKVLEKGYGSNKVSISKPGFRSIQEHCTKVSGIIWICK